ncbi:hypothetical protein EV421DRAFT_1255428 [Armillaria borealis]|uniref:Secreted protein n=1 Tax=Armillaria borealis TaxID=47425 RepID=A0AA39J314_9AGAR|nr:hypothetical protein EV421DRAFT_1255428 [Armillaria borealis]
MRNWWGRHMFSTLWFAMLTERAGVLGVSVCLCTTLRLGRIQVHLYIASPVSSTTNDFWEKDGIGIRKQRKNCLRKRPSGSMVEVKHIYSVMSRMKAVLFRVSSVHRLKNNTTVLGTKTARLSIV